MSWLVNLSASSELVVNYEKAMGGCSCYFDNSTKQPKVGNISRSKQIIDLIAAIIHIKKSPSKIDCGTSVRFMINYPAPKVLSDFTKFMKYGKNKTRLINIIYAIISSDYKGICAVISSDCKRALALVKCSKIYFSK